MLFTILFPVIVAFAISPPTIVPSTMLELLIQDAGKLAVVPDTIKLPPITTFPPINTFPSIPAPPVTKSAPVILLVDAVELLIVWVPATDSVAPDAIVSVVPVANVFVPPVIL